MAEGYLAWELLVLQERVRRIERQVERRLLRNAQNPFELPHNEFIAHFRVSQELAMDLLNILTRFTEGTNKRFISRSASFSSDQLLC